MGASGKRKVVAIRRKRLPGGRYLQLYVLDGVGPRGGRTVGYIQSKKVQPASSSPAPSGSPAPGSSAPAEPRVIVKRKRHGGNGPRSRGR